MAKNYSAGAMEKASLARAVSRAGNCIFDLPKIWCGDDFKDKRDPNPRGGQKGGHRAFFFKLVFS